MQTIVAITIMFSNVSPIVFVFFFQVPAAAMSPDGPAFFAPSSAGRAAPSPDEAPRPSPGASEDL